MPLGLCPGWDSKVQPPLIAVLLVVGGLLKIGLPGPGRGWVRCKQSGGPQCVFGRRETQTRHLSVIGASSDSFLQVVLPRLGGRCPSGMGEVSLEKLCKYDAASLNWRYGVCCMWLLDYALGRPHPHPRITHVIGGQNKTHIYMYIYNIIIYTMFKYVMIPVHILYFIIL